MIRMRGLRRGNRAPFGCRTLVSQAFTPNWVRIALIVTSRGLRSSTRDGERPRSTWRHSTGPRAEPSCRAVACRFQLLKLRRATTT